jgi:hypothetical protein
LLTPWNTGPPSSHPPFPPPQVYEQPGLGSTNQAVQYATIAAVVTYYPNSYPMVVQNKFIYYMEQCAFPCMGHYPAASPSVFTAYTSPLGPFNNTVSFTSTDATAISHQYNRPGSYKLWLNFTYIDEFGTAREMLTASTLHITGRDTTLQWQTRIVNVSEPWESQPDAPALNYTYFFMAGSEEVRNVVNGRETNYSYPYSYDYVRSQPFFLFRIRVRIIGALYSHSNLYIFEFFLYTCCEVFAKWSPSLIVIATYCTCLSLYTSIHFLHIVLR